MLDNKYAVVRLAPEGAPMQFKKWHDTYELAKAEAERLCRKEKDTFGIVRLVSYCEVEETPVKWTE